MAIWCEVPLRDTGLDVHETSTQYFYNHKSMKILKQEKIIFSFCCCGWYPNFYFQMAS